MFNSLLHNEIQLYKVLCTIYAYNYISGFQSIALVPDHIYC